MYADPLLFMMDRDLAEIMSTHSLQTQLKHLSGGGFASQATVTHNCTANSVQKSFWPLPNK